MILTGTKLKDTLESNPTLTRVKWSSLHNNEYGVVKYSNSVHYSRDSHRVWQNNPWLIHCRGLVINKDYDVVGRGFPKIFNYGEQAPTYQFSSGVAQFNPEQEVYASKKYNGFMCTLSVLKDELLVSTTGTLDSQYVDMAFEILDATTRTFPFKEGTSYLYEICHPADPHIIQEKIGAYFLGSIDVATAKVTPAEYKACKFSDILKEMETCNHEGYVVYDTLLSSCLKFKSPMYLAYKRLARMQSDKLRNVQDTLPLPYRDLFITPEFAIASEQVRLQMLRQYDKEIRKMYHPLESSHGN